MLETLEKIALTAVLVTAIALSPGCYTYQTMSQDQINSAIRTEIPTKKRPMIDYSKLTWQEAIEYIKTPKQAQSYLNNHFNYDPTELGGLGLAILSNSKGESFKENHEKAEGVCIDYATAAAALLSDNGYEPLILAMKGNRGAHAVFLYKESDKFGILGIDYTDPIYSTIDGVISAINEKHSQVYGKYAVANLDSNFSNWISGDNINMQTPFFDKWELVDMSQVTSSPISNSSSRIKTK